jgi:DNA-binding transcriptional ArsR family regulator
MMARTTNRECLMTNIASLAGTAALLGDPARAAMLVTLMDGRALTAGELAGAAGITPQTASGHLGRMLDAGLLALERQGRHRYYRIANTAVARLVEELMAISGELSAVRLVRTGPRDRALRAARVCYDHLAGEVAVGIADAMIARGQLNFAPDGGMLTEAGHDFLRALGIDLTDDATSRYCRPCLDWSERRPHLAGRVGRALYAGLLRQDWVRAPAKGRAVAVTPIGRAMLAQHFGLSFSDGAPLSR